MNATATEPTVNPFARLHELLHARVQAAEVEAEAARTAEAASRRPLLDPGRAAHADLTRLAENLPALRTLRSDVENLPLPATYGVEIRRTQEEADGVLRLLSTYRDALGVLLAKAEKGLSLTAEEAWDLERAPGHAAEATKRLEALGVAAGRLADALERHTPQAARAPVTVTHPPPAWATPPRGATGLGTTSPEDG